MRAEPYTARQCPVCGVWVYCGPRGSRQADYRHWTNEHKDLFDADNESGDTFRTTTFPFFTWNDEPVEIAA